MTVIHISDFQERRAAAETQLETYMGSLAGGLVEQSVQHANRAFAAASPFLASDPELGHIIYQGVRRRLRAVLRRQVGRDAPPELKQSVLDEADRVFRGRVFMLIDLRDASKGGAA